MYKTSLVLAASLLALSSLTQAAPPVKPAKEPIVKVRIQAMEGDGTILEAQFNPKEITIDKSVSWQKHEGGKGDVPALEFNSADAKELTVTLLFDTFETKGDVHAKYITALENLAKVDDNLKRPPMVQFVWGSNLPVFQGVVDHLAVTYTLFLPDATPVRATVVLHMRQSNTLMNANEPGGHCHDHVRDGDEVGTDCGGSCYERCASAGQ